ncbi:28460_t:CDS:2, partial [Gigaspora margarita]
QVEQITKIRIRQGILKECIIQDIWQYQDIKLDERVWYKGSWHLQGKGPTIISMLDSKLEKQSKQTCIDFGSFSGKVPLWFRKLEELLIDDAESHKVKEDLFSNDINTSILQPHCENVTSVNRHKQWIWFTQKNTKKWHLSRITKLLEKSALIEHWTEMHIQGNKCVLLKCKDCNLNTKGKKNECMINCNKNLIRGTAVGITKRENNWITNFPTILLKDKPEYHLIPVQECLLLQIKEIDSTERELVKLQNFTEKKNECYRDEDPEEETNWFFCWENLKEIKGSKCKSEDTKHICLELEAQAISLAWAHLKDETRAVIILRDLCITVLHKMRQEQCRA